MTRTYIVVRDDYTVYHRYLATEPDAKAAAEERAAQLNRTSGDPGRYYVVEQTLHNAPPLRA